MNHDIIVIGASAGGLEALLDIVPDLPADLPASLFIVVHSHAAFPSTLPEILSAHGKLPATHPVHGEPVRPGRIYVAPPDNQLYLRLGTIDVVRGPRENGHRPAVDALFRTASAAYGPRVVGVVLSGYLDCGTAGMMSITARGGIVVVQDPETAAAPDMPRHVLERVKVDHVARPLDMPGLITRLASTPAPAPREPDAPVKQLEAGIGTAVGEVVCPHCQGVMTEVEHLGEFQCHVGHRFSLESLVREQGESLERALWSAVRALEEAAAMSRRLVISAKGDMASRFAEQARTYQVHAGVIRDVLLQT